MNPESSHQRLMNPRRNAGIWLLLAIATAVVFILLVILLNRFPTLPDFTVYHGTARKWIAGETRLYDAEGRNFFNAPWLMLVLGPLALLPEKTASSIWSIMSLVLIIASLHAFRQNRRISLLATVLSLANLPTVMLLFNGQADAFPLAGMALGWWAIHRRRAWWLGVALSLMAIKPTHFPLVFLLYLWAIRGWSRQDWLRTLTPLALLSLGAGLIIGFDWPLRYADNLTASPPIDNGTVVLWKLVAEAGIPPAAVATIAIVLLTMWVIQVRREGLTLPTLGIALATTFTFTLYAWIYHYILLAPALLYLLHKHRAWGVLIYLTTWAGAVRMSTTGAVFGNSDIIYPAGMLAAYWAIAGRSWWAARKKPPSSG